MKKLSVLLGGNESLFCDLRKAALEYWGYDVVAVADGKQACSAVLSGQVQLCILDWDLPDISGLQVCRWIRSVNLKVQPHVVVLTRRDQPEQVQAAYYAGANDFIAKPFNLEDLHFLVSGFAQRLSKTYALPEESKPLDPMEQYRRDLAASAKIHSRI
jgi:DNA-binding response OmpR family regulator